MKSKRSNYTKRNRGKTRTSKNRKKTRKNTKWVTAIDAAQSVLKDTGSLQRAQRTLKRQALFNARRLFGSIGKYFV
jgi:hypothetical protein